ncbi:BatD family protein [Riemerella columbina]|uniref:BatD family protein n=1 Tax=Riemerella columbina TaxID=103810 RepID=UPI0003A75403|nr:BatD family protein [Riemerella columbina]
MFKRWCHILFWIWSASIYGQVTFHADTDLKELKANEAVRFTVFLQINGAEYVQESLLQLPDFSKFDVIDDGSTRNTFVDPAKNIAVAQVVYQVLLLPKKAGKIKMGSALVTINGKIYKTEPFDILVEGKSEPATVAKANDEIQLKLQSKSKRVYQNQPTIVVLRAFTKNIDNFQKLSDIKIPKTNGLTFYPISQKTNDIEQGSGNLSLSKVLGVYLLYSTQGGTVEIPEISAKVSNAGKTEKVNTQKVDLKIKTLPKNAPQNFKNAVGDFKLDINYPDDKELELDQPTKVTIKLSGIGNFDKIQLPKIINNSKFQTFQPKISKSIKPSTQGLKGSVQAEYIIIPKDSGDLSIAVEPFSFFNLKHEQYETISPEIQHFKTKTAASETINDQQIEKMIDNTNKMLDLVKLPHIDKKQSESKNRWLFYGLNLIGLLIIASLFYFFIKNRRKIKKSIIHLKSEYTETKPELNFDFEHNYSQLKSALEEKNDTLFFKAFQDLQEKTMAYLDTSYTKLNHTIEAKYGHRVAEEYRLLVSKIEVEKYTPIKDWEQLNQLYYEIINWHHRIVG